MKRQSVKNQLIEKIIANGKPLKYTEVIKLIMFIHNPKVEYNWKEHRGYYATNMGQDRGYLCNGGDGQLYKTEDGLWYARWFTEAEKLEYKMAKLITSAMIDVVNTISRYNNGLIWAPYYDIKLLSKDYAKKISTKLLSK